MAIVRRPRWTPLADPPGPDAATATQFGDLASSDLALLDAADAALDLPRTDALGAFDAGVSALASIGDDLTVAGDELDALLADVEEDRKFDFLAEGDLWDSLLGSL